MVHEPDRRVVEMAEQFADGSCPYEDLRKAFSSDWILRDADPVAWAVVTLATEKTLYKTRVAWATAIACAAAESRRLRAHLWQDAYSAWRLALDTADNVADHQERWQNFVRITLENLDRQEPSVRQTYRHQADLLRDIIGNPFQPRNLDPVLLAWNGGLLPRIARSIYDQRSFDDMPILADALEEAGCRSEDVLHHCRGAGPHTGGCWLLDQLLGRE
jgi:hypothetical protein